MTEEQIYQKLSALCASAEHCSYEMTEKMRRWQVPDDMQARVMERLVKERFVDDERYCRFFVRDKIRYNKWGRRKVEQALYMKRIPTGIQERVLDEVDPQVYVDILRQRQADTLRLGARLHAGHHKGVSRRLRRRLSLFVRFKP